MPITNRFKCLTYLGNFLAVVKLNDERYNGRRCQKLGYNERPKPFTGVVRLGGVR